MKARGVSGQLRAGGRNAATLGPWTATQEGVTWTFEAQVRTVDAYWIAASGPFELRLHVGTRAWVWRNVTFEGRDRLTIHAIGRPEFV